MATTINAYSVSLGLDASGFIDGSKLSRSEVNKLKKDIHEARDPTERLAVEQDRLTKALESGAISESVYNRLLETKRKNLLDVADATSKVTSSSGSMLDTMSKVGNVVSGLRHAFDMVGSAISTAKGIFDSFADRLGEIDTANKAARKLGLTFNELGSLKFATQEIGGSEAVSALEKGLEQMMKRGLVQPGESAVDAFKRVADQMAGMASQSDKIKFAFDTFGKSGADLVGVLQEGSAAIEDSVKFWQETNGMTQAQAISAEMIGDKIERVKQTIQGIANIAAVELMPAFSMILESLLGMETNAGSVQAAFRKLSDEMVGTVAFYKSAWGNSSLLNPSIDFDTDKHTDAQLTAEFKLKEQRQTMAVEARRKEKQLERERQESLENQKKLSEEAAAKAAQAEQERIEKQKNDYSDLINGNKAEWDQFIKEKEAKEKESIKSIEKARSELMKRNKAMRDAAEKSPSGIESGSAEAAKAMAEIINRQIAATMEPASAAAKPTEEQILKEAERQVKLAEINSEQNKKMSEQLTRLIEVAEQNGFKRIR